MAKKTKEDKKEEFELEEDSWEEEELEDWDDLDDELEEEDEEAEGKISKKQKQNYLAAIIVLAGLFLGSLFIDTVQLISGEGISQKKLAEVDIFSLGGKTWLSSNDPIVELIVLNDENCEECQAEPVLEAIKTTALPTAAVRKVALNSKEGKELVEKFNIKAIPAFIFDEKVSETEFYTQAQPVLEEKEGQYLLNNALAGIPSGKFIVVPEFQSAAASLGNPEAPVKVSVFSDFQCPYSKQFSETLDKVYDEYSDKIQVSFHQLPLRSIHPQAYNAALASLCANGQGKFWEMNKALFDNQSEWGASEAGKNAFGKYAASAGLDSAQFQQCLNEEKYKEAVEKDEASAQEFGLSGTPAIFVNDQFLSGAPSEDQLKEVIEKELEK